MLLSQGWCQYQFDKRLEGYSPRTLKAYLIQSNLLIRYFGDIEMDSLQAEDLKQYLVKDADPSLFVTERVPYRMSVAQMRYIIKPISSRSGINKSIHPHQLRYSYATHMLNNGAPLEVIQNLMGHEKSETTRIYAQLSGSMR